jgi:ABC-type dipeptide/oligopeptide/nickel transport system permease subunit
MNPFQLLLGRRRSTVHIIPVRGVTQRLLARPSARIGIGIGMVLIAMILFVPLVSFSLPEHISLSDKLSPPSLEHLLGTDQFGRDQLVRIADGGRRSLGAAVLVLGGTLLVSLFVGITVGMIGGIVESVTMRIVDVFLALPSLVLALAVVGVLGVGFRNLMLALILSSWAYYARLARSYVQLARDRNDVIVDRLAGVSWSRIATGHIVPGVVTQLAVVATLDLGGIIVGVSGLSFLGLGVQPPDAEWGAMLAESRLFFTTAPWLLLAPGLAIFLAVISANLTGNALRDAADSRNQNIA